MSSKKIITVFGATGVVGGSVAKYLLEDGQFAVRAVTRSASSDKAKALAADGAEIVEADLSKPETLAAAVKGAYGVSSVTDFWSIMYTVGFDTAKAQAEEERQAKNLVDAAKSAGVQHFVYFSLPHSNVPHFEGKYQAGEYLKRSGVPYTIVTNSFYFENVANAQFGMLAKAESGGLLLNIPIPPDVYVPSYSADETGGWVVAVFKNPTDYLGKDDVHLIGENLTPRQYAETISKTLGVSVAVKDLSKEEFESQAQSDNVFVKELYLNMKYFADYCQPGATIYDQAGSAKVYPKNSNFERFVKENPKFKAYAASLV
jgi:uncharacterized protein YbjT (DUF2867 family)